MYSQVLFVVNENFEKIEENDDFLVKNQILKKACSTPPIDFPLLGDKLLIFFWVLKAVPARPFSVFPFFFSVWNFELSNLTYLLFTLKKRLQKTRFHPNMHCQVRKYYNFIKSWYFEFFVTKNDQFLLKNVPKI